MGKIKVTQIKSAINRPGRQKLTLKALGLGKINRTVEHEANTTNTRYGKKGGASNQNRKIRKKKFSNYEITHFKTSRRIY